MNGLVFAPKAINCKLTLRLCVQAFQANHKIDIAIIELNLPYSIVLLDLECTRIMASVDKYQTPLHLMLPYLSRNNGQE